MNPARNKKELNFSRWLMRSILALALAANSLAVAQQTNTLTRLDYESFKIITDRNIFNPNRSSRSPSQYTRRETPRETKTEFFALVGTMNYEKGLFAFFDGSSSEYRKVLKTTDAIAGYKVMNIAPNQVKLASGTNEVNLPVGMQMRRDEEGGWTLTARAETDLPSPSQPATARTSSSPSAAGSTPQSVAANGESAIVSVDTQPESNATNTGPATDSGGGENDILARLRQRREQELNR